MQTNQKFSSHITKHIQLQSSFADTLAAETWRKKAWKSSRLPGLLHLGFAPELSGSTESLALGGNKAVSRGKMQTCGSCLLEPQSVTSHNDVTAFRGEKSPEALEECKLILEAVLTADGRSVPRMRHALGSDLLELISRMAYVYGRFAQSSARGFRA